MKYLITSHSAGDHAAGAWHYREDRPIYISSRKQMHDFFMQEGKEFAVDDLVLSMDGKAMNDLTQARLAIAMASGHTVNMVLFHGGRKVTKRVTVPSVW